MKTTMRMLLIGLLVTTLWVTAASADPARNKASAIAYMRELETGRDIPAAFARYVATPFIHHSPQMPEGRDKIIQFLVEATASNRGSRWELRRAVAEGDLVVLHGKIVPKPEEKAPEIAIANIFRFDAQGKIAEEWAVLQTAPAVSANRYGMF